MCLVWREVGLSLVAAAGCLFAPFLLFFLFALCGGLRVAVLVPFRFLRGRLVDVLIDVLDFLPGLFVVNLALQLGQLFAQFNDLLVFFCQKEAGVLALSEDHGNEFGPWIVSPAPPGPQRLAHGLSRRRRSPR